MTRAIGFLAIGCAFAFFIACTIGAVRARDARMKAEGIERSLLVQRNDAARMCRMQLGIDYDFHQRQLMMACAQEVVDANKIGNNRFVAATKAWQQCMPDMAVCEKALRP